VSVTVTVTHGDAGWSAHGQLLNADNAADFAFLCELDPMFHLACYDGEVGIPVMVRPAEDFRTFTLTELGSA
jgi:hypothetical protein